jgi:L,D-transpeptidase catalytic domain/Putative peptidoglycan binding domain
MRTRFIVLTGVLVVLLLAGTGAVYAYDHGHKGSIAEGVSVNGVDVGGMTAAQARTRLRAKLLAPLDRPVKVRYQGHTYTLTRRAAAIGVDIDGSVARAEAASRQGSMFTRTWREVRGQTLKRDLDAKITYSRPAVRKLVHRVRDSLNKEPVDASLDLDEGQIDPKPSSDGLRVRTGRLQNDLARELLDAGTRRVRVHADVLEPEVATADLAKKYPAILMLNRGAFQLTLYKNLKLAKTYSVAIGRVGLETPAGLYHIQNKAVNPAWTMPNSSWVAPGDRGKVVPGGTPQNPLKARWLGIFAGAGIHGTDETGSIGTAASHGCVRMRIPDVIDLYPQVPVGAPIYIA